MNKIIEVKHLKKNYGDKEVLKDINAVIEKGKVITVMVHPVQARVLFCAV